MLDWAAQSMINIAGLVVAFGPPILVLHLMEVRPPAHESWQRATLAGILAFLAFIVSGAVAGRMWGTF